METICDQRPAPTRPRLGCDIRLISSGAKLISGFAKRGIIPESGGTWYLPRPVGSHHVLMQLLLLFRSHDLQEGIASFLEKRPAVFAGR